MPCASSGSVTTTVPAPSHTSTAASMSSVDSAIPISSEMPYDRKSRMRIWRAGVHMPKSCIRNSMFLRMVSTLSSVIPLVLRNKGQTFTCGSPTSMTLPSSITTLASPSASITCRSMMIKLVFPHPKSSLSPFPRKRRSTVRPPWHLLVISFDRGSVALMCVFILHSVP